jgi:large subunit ribosomal protein L21
MFAIVDIKGSQYRVNENDKIYVPKIELEQGKEIEFDKVLMYSPDDKVFEVGSPYLSRKVKATIIEQVKDEKVIVFKKKRRKGYKVRKGHRQQYTQISIDKIF